LKAFRALEVLPKVNVIWPLESTRLTPFLEAPPLVDFSTFFVTFLRIWSPFYCFPVKEDVFLFWKAKSAVFQENLTIRELLIRQSSAIFLVVFLLEGIV